MADLIKLLKQAFLDAGTYRAAFDPATDLILNAVATVPEPSADDHAAIHFREYFVSGSLGGAIEPGAPRRRALGDIVAPQACEAHYPGPWPIPDPCAVVDGRRGTLDHQIRRLLAGDLVWLYYMERMGVFQILGGILDDYALIGRHPISSRQLAVIVVESMVRELRSGLGSTTRDRDVAYRRCLGWTSEVGRTLGSEAAPNRAFSAQFHRLIRLALQFYKDRQLAVAIRDVVTPTRASTATLIAIRDTMRVLQKSCEVFEYGRTYTTALNGIVWVLGALTVIRDLRRDLGIPESYSSPWEYVPAAYSLFVEPEQTDRRMQPDPNRYFAHRECANAGRNIMLDVEVLPINDRDFATPGGVLETWLNLAESSIEGYRTGYQSLTEINLADGEPVVGQAA